MLDVMREASSLSFKNPARSRYCRLRGATLSLALLVGACGHPEQEWQAQLDKYNELGKQNQSQQAELERVRADIARLNADLQKHAAGGAAPAGSAPPLSGAETLPPGHPAMGAAPGAMPQTKGMAQPLSGYSTKLPPGHPSLDSAPAPGAKK